MLFEYLHIKLTNKNNMKKPQILKLVDNALGKLRANPKNWSIEENTYRNQLLSTVVKLLSSIPEDSPIRGYVMFERSIKNLIIEDFRSRSNRGISVPLMRYVDQDFVNNFILQSDNIWHSEKHEWLSDDVVFPYYEQIAVVDLLFNFTCRHEDHPCKWFKGLPESKKSEILIARLELSKKEPSIRVISEIIKSSDDIELFTRAALYVDTYKLWNDVFDSDKKFDPDSDEGIALMPIAEHLSSELWIMDEIVKVGKMTKWDRVTLDEKIEKIRKYFGHVNLPQQEVMNLVTNALDDDDSIKAEYCSKFLV
jgi:hypothetical protein